MAEEFLISTNGWSGFFLNDVPLSRRPWLHRPAEYKDIDELLSNHTGLTLYAQRKHPEEFAAHFLSTLSGLFFSHFFSLSI